MLLNRLTHRALRLACWRGDLQFRRQCYSLEKVQRDRLARLLRQTPLAGRQAALMANHGSVAIGATLARAVDNALLLEWLAALQHRASALGEPRVLTETQQHDVIAQAIALDYGSTKESQ